MQVIDFIVIVAVAGALSCGGVVSVDGPAEQPGASAAAVGAPAPAAQVGSKAPDFTLTDLDGKSVRLADFAGRTVVLEWFNPDCPFVRFAHGETGPLRTQPARHNASGVVWLAINSGAPGKEGTGLDRNRKAVQDYAMGYPVLLDESGTTGRAYGAKSTPHMFVVDPQGTLVYAGGLDNRPLGNGDGEATNHVDAALSDLAAGRPVATSSTKSYGCSVKYGS
jgi:peroxiredoxin